MNARKHENRENEILCFFMLSQCTFSMEHNFMLSDTENGRMFRFNSFRAHTHQTGETRKPKQLAKNSIKRECERIRKTFAHSTV